MVDMRIQITKTDLPQRSTPCLLVYLIFHLISLLVVHYIKWVDSYHDRISDHGLDTIVIKPASNCVQEGVLVECLQV